MINIGDYVTRKSHNNDIIFKVVNIENKIVYLKGVDVRLIADSPVNDLTIITSYRKEDEIKNIIDKLNRNEYFYIPGKVMHIDSDEDYLKRCIKYYNDNKIEAITKCIKEDKIYTKIEELLKEYNPDILVITGHDAYKNGKYKNSDYYSKAILKARKYENDKNKLIIIAGACQSNYELLIKSGATYASSPKRVNIHALDPAIVSTYISLSEIGKDIDIKEMLSITKSKEEGIGGIISKGKMYKGYPRGNNEY